MTGVVNAPCSVLTAAQYRFLWLHDSHTPTKWRWLFGHAILRAYTERGQTASISSGELERLIEAGLMKRGAGYADVLITETGREAAS